MFYPSHLPLGQYERYTPPPSMALYNPNRTEEWVRNKDDPWDFKLVYNRPPHCNRVQPPGPDGSACEGSAYDEFDLCELPLHHLQPGDMACIEQALSSVSYACMNDFLCPPIVQLTATAAIKRLMERDPRKYQDDEVEDAAVVLCPFGL
jgi:hypothetical protein